MEGVELSSSIPYIFVSGGVLSGLGKGVATAALGLLLKSRGYKVTIVKCENYLNIDAGLINPIEHGAPFLCEDGPEAHRRTQNQAHPTIGQTIKCDGYSTGFYSGPVTYPYGSAPA